MPPARDRTEAADHCLVAERRCCAASALQTFGTVWQYTSMAAAHCAAGCVGEQAPQLCGADASAMALNRLRHEEQRPGDPLQRRAGIPSRACLPQEALAGLDIRSSPIASDNIQLLEQFVVHDRSSAVDGGDRSIAPEYVA